MDKTEADKTEADKTEGQAAVAAEQAVAAERAVEVMPVLLNGKRGYDLRVKDPEATVQDYLDALCQFIENSPCFRERNPALNTCMGCDKCCQERIPVTLLDAVRLAGPSLARTLQEDLHVFVQGRVVDITLGLNEDGKCRRLDPATGLCRTYNRRPLVCRTFICCPSTQRARLLREEIVNTGEDELVRQWFKTSDGGCGPVIHEAISPSLDPADYAATPFAGAVSYVHVKIKDICSPQLWKKLTSRT